ncbi:DUF6615 family protein [Kitasatospora sp. NBC_01300]|uniref:DUF6615 family protein n=1 Tax=Kitasatospora sp. NBC_01300 TaxID=2903574 RepID=UPI002F90B437|nr:hypothetical protein OG556_35430 [Kitasatospora sp. NBC_01300]
MPTCGICDHETAEFDNYCGNCGAQQVSHGAAGHRTVPSANSMCRTLRACATRTFERLSLDHYDVPEDRVPREETYTSLNLQDLRRLHSDRVSIVEFTQLEETRNGADWEWWFHANGEGFGMRVQAKRAMRGGGYRLEHRTRARERQSELLVRDAVTAGCVSAYVLYNHRNWVPTFAEGTTEACAHGAGLTGHMGCTIVSALTVRAVLEGRGNSSAKVRDASMPWHWVLCGERRQHSDLETAYREVQRLHRRGLDALKEAIRTGTGQGVGHQPTPTAGPSAGPVDTEAGAPVTGHGAGLEEDDPTEGGPPPQLHHSTLDSVRLTPEELAAREAEADTRVQAVLEGPLYRGMQDLVDAPAGRLPGRVLDMIRRREAGVAPDERVAGAVLVDLSPRRVER